MDFQKMYELALALSTRISRFELHQMDQEAERREGRLAGFTRFERGEIRRLYEKFRLERIQ